MPPGEYEPARDTCEPCRAGKYCVGGMEINCPDSTWNDVRGASDVSQCRPCPQPGTICRSGEPLRVSAGYYMDGVAANHSYRCATRAACLGGELSFGDASCEAGYTGLICGACKAGYYRGRRTCLSCESSTWKAALARA